MKTNVYVIRDVVACESGPLFEAKNDGTALRHFERVAADSEYADEFILLCVGAYDHDQDVLVGFDARVVEPTVDAVDVDQEEGA